MLARTAFVDPDRPGEQLRGASRLASVRGLVYYGEPAYDEQQRELMGERRVIPIDAFGSHLRHGPMIADDLATGLTARSVERLWAVLSDSEYVWEDEVPETVRAGCAEGRLVVQEANRQLSYRPLVRLVIIIVRFASPLRVH